MAGGSGDVDYEMPPAQQAALDAMLPFMMMVGNRGSAGYQDPQNQFYNAYPGYQAQMPPAMAYQGGPMFTRYTGGTYGGGAAPPGGSFPTPGGPPSTPPTVPPIGPPGTQPPVPQLPPGQTSGGTTINPTMNRQEFLELWGGGGSPEKSALLNLGVNNYQSYLENVVGPLQVPKTMSRSEFLNVWQDKGSVEKQALKAMGVGNYASYLSNVVGPMGVNPNMTKREFNQMWQEGGSAEKQALKQAGVNSYGGYIDYVSGVGQQPTGQLPNLPAKEVGGVSINPNLNRAEFVKLWQAGESPEKSALLGAGVKNFAQYLNLMQS